MIERFEPKLGGEPSVRTMVLALSPTGALHPGCWEAGAAARRLLLAQLGLQLAGLSARLLGFGAELGRSREPPP